MGAAVSASCGTGETGSAAPAEPPASEPPASGVSSPVAPSSTTATAPVPTGPAACRSVIDSMTPRQRVAQLVVVGVDGSDVAQPVELARTEQVGGIFIGGNATELLSGDGVRQVREAAPLPVSIAVDDEGGRVQRIDELDGSLPSPRKMAETMSADQVRELARDRGAALARHGVTVDYAPVVDVSEQPADTAIGDRSFSADPNIAREYALAFATGLRESGIVPVLKHFPGHGHADGDSHRSLVFTPPLAELAERDLVPYRDIADYPQASVMVGHLAVPDLTDGEPASLAPSAYRLLREQYRFTGPVVTDDLGAMRAVQDRYSLPDAALKALQSGADQALWSAGGRVGEVLDRLTAAVDSGELPDERVRDALGRVLADKNACD